MVGEIIILVIKLIKPVKIVMLSKMIVDWIINFFEKASLNVFLNNSENLSIFLVND